MNPKIEELVKILIQKEMKNDEITGVRNELLAKAYEDFMREALKSLTDEDLQKVDTAETQEKAAELLKSVYQEKTGRNAEEEMKKIVDQKADEFIEKHKNDSGSQVSNNTQQSSSDALEIKKAEDELHTIAENTKPEDTTPPLDPTEVKNPDNWQ